MKRHAHWIDGEEIWPSSGEFLPSLDPMTGEPWAEIARGDEEDVERAVTSAHEAFQSWRRSGATVRAEVIWRIGELIHEHADELAALESRDAGKVIREVRGQMSALRLWYRYYSSLAYHMEGREIPHDRQSLRVFTQRRPYGVIGIIPPFNSPLLLGSMAIGPALAAGNTVVVKPPEINALALLRLGDLAKQAGLPDGCLNVVCGLGGESGDALVRHPLVRKVFFTGGPDSARKVQQAAAMGLKPTTLELGGKSANIFFDDVDVPSVVNGVIAGIFAAAGQTCVAGSRLLVHESIADDLVARVVERAQTIVLGDPRDLATEMGPMSQTKLRDGAIERIESARSAGATILAGGPAAPIPDRGWFLAPTVVDDVSPDMDVVRHEIFGPVLTVMRFSTEEMAIELANDTEYGLSAGVWTRNLGRGLRVAEALDTGTVWVNTYRALNFAVPFGGNRFSGHGRENGMDGFAEFTEPKATWIEMSDEPVGDPFTLRT